MPIIARICCFMALNKIFAGLAYWSYWEDEFWLNRLSEESMPKFRDSSLLLIYIECLAQCSYEVSVLNKLSVTKLERLVEFFEAILAI